MRFVTIAMLSIQMPDFQMLLQLHRMIRSKLVYHSLSIALQTEAMIGVVIGDPLVTNNVPKAC
jgi:hypothetical protein